jgi:glycosyltransferase involved in cell wall biosynthesis
MKINVVMGFFLPMPPAAGGATEKSWDGLAREFARLGHEVTVISRTWPGWPAREVLDGVHHLRLEGHPHTGSLLRNLWHDYRWSRRVGPALPAADVTIVNAVTLPVWLRRRHPGAGRVVVMPGRVPKGQFRVYRSIDRVIAVSSPVRDAVVAENPQLAPVIRLHGYPIDWTGLAPRPAESPGGVVTVGYVGRLHREKGLSLLAGAAALLSAQPDLPRWRVLLAGPVDVARGGSGEAYARELDATLLGALGPDRYERLPAAFTPEALAQIYHRIDVFCYPSCSVRGETFGVAVAEAMAAGAVPAVSGLRCFTDFVHDGANGRVFDQAAPDATAQLATVVRALLRDPAERARLAAAARVATRRYDFPEFAASLLADFSTLK